MIKLFISQPMRDRTDDEIITERENAKLAAEKILNEEVVIMDSFFQIQDNMKPLEYLGESLKVLANADLAWFCGGWEQARGCRIEHQCALDYGIAILHA